MPETLHEKMTPNDIFRRITEVIDEGRFPGIPTPQLVYTFFRSAVDHMGCKYTQYASTAITSGGAALPTKEGETLPFGEALAKNTDFAINLMRSAIEDNPDYLTADNHVNPVLLGKIPIYHYEQYGTQKVVDRFWGQDDYLRLWFAVISGIEAPDHGQNPLERSQDTHDIINVLFEAHRDLSTELEERMNDSSSSHEERGIAYKEFTDTFIFAVNFLHGLGKLTVKPVESLIGLIDYERSLGCRSEFQLAERLGISTIRFAIAGSDWSSTSFASSAEVLDMHGALFSAPADRVVMALAPRLFGQTEDVSLSLAQQEQVATKPEAMRDELFRDLLPRMQATVSGEGAEALAAHMAQLATRVSQDKRAYFHPYVIEEILGVAGGFDDDIDPFSPDSTTRSAAHMVREMRDSSYRIY